MSGSKSLLSQFEGTDEVKGLRPLQVTNSRTGWHACDVDMSRCGQVSQNSRGNGSQER